MNHLGLYSSYNSCTGVSLSSHCLSSLKAVVRNKFLTTANSHRLHSLLLLLWTKWFFRPACVKKLGGALDSELLIFVSLNKVFSNFALGGRERVYVWLVRAEKERRSYTNHLGLYSSYNSCTGVSLRSHRLSSLKAVVRNKFLTTANSHRLHSLLLLLWTKWFFRPACKKS